MNPTLNDPRDIPSPFPSCAGPRRPTLTRTHASRNLFPDLPPIQTTCTSPPDIDTVAFAGDVRSTISGGPCDHGGQPVKIPPTCPASPPSPISSSSESSTSSLPTPLEADDWERFHDGFAPPPNSPRPHVHHWPPTPNPNITPEFPLQARDSYHGWSGNSLFEMKRFWYRRHRAWWDYDEHCRHLQNYLAAASTSEGNLDATMYYPSSPALLPSRLIPWSSANGISFNTERIATDTDTLALPRAPRLQVHPPWAPVFPRFGDIDDLRDPSCEHFDRMFMNFPPYAISKLLYVEQMAAREHDARVSQRALEPALPTLPSLSASLDAPWSPGSVYSEDGRGLAEISTMATSSTISLPSRASGLYGGLRWFDRWELLRRRLFPQSIPLLSATSPTSPLRSPAESDPALSSPPVHLPPRPGTPLPDDEPNHAAFLGHLADAHSEREPGESTARSDSLRVCAESVDPSGPIPPPEADAVDAPVSLSDANPSDADGDPVVRLPSSSHPPRTYAAHLAPDMQDARSPRREPRTLADELNAALGSSGVQFSVAPPSAVVRVSSRFSFFAEEGLFDSKFEYEEATGFGVGVTPLVSPNIASSSVHVEAVPC